MNKNVVPFSVYAYIAAICTIIVGTCYFFHKITPAIYFVCVAILFYMLAIYFNIKQQANHGQVQLDFIKAVSAEIHNSWEQTYSGNAPSLFLEAHFSITNTSLKPVSIANVYIRKPRTPGFHLLRDAAQTTWWGGSNNINPSKTLEMMVYFSIGDKKEKEGTFLKFDITIVDNLSNRIELKDVLFRPRKMA